jgi:hypothetical protein
MGGYNNKESPKTLKWANATPNEMKKITGPRERFMFHSISSQVHKGISSGMQ